MCDDRQKRGCVSELSAVLCALPAGKDCGASRSRPPRAPASGLDLCVLSAQVLHNSRRLHLGDAADAARHAISGLASGLKAALAAPLQGLQNALKAASPAALGAAGALPTTAGRSLARAEGQSAEAERQAKAASPVAGPVRSDATVRVSTISPEDGTGATAHMEARLAGDSLVQYSSRSFLDRLSAVVARMNVVQLSSCMRA